MRVIPPWCAIVFLGATTLAGAQTPAGPEFVVNTYTTGDEGYPEVAVQPSGAFEVAWNRRPPLAGDGDIFARFFTAGGTPTSDEFRVNSATAQYQGISGGSFALNARGRGVAAFDNLGGSIEVWARQLQGGVGRGPDFLVQSNISTFQANPRAAVAPDARFVVAWEDLDTRQILARRFDPQGAPLGQAFQVTTNTSTENRLGAVAIDTTGNFTVVWDRTGPNFTEPQEVWASRYAANGQQVGAEFVVNAFTTGRQEGPSIGLAADGSAVVVWSGTGAGTQFETWGRRLSPTGSPLGGDFRLGSTPSGDFVEQVNVAVGEMGDFAVVWSVSGSSGYPALRGRRFEGNGAPRAPVIAFGATTVHSSVRPRVAADSAGNLVVVWHDTALNGFDVLAQRFGGFFPAALTVDGASGGGSNGDGVLQPGESVTVAPTWRNLTTAPQAFAGLLTSPSGPPGATYTITDASGSYGTVASGGTQVCVDCYGVSVSNPATRPAQHWDASVVENITPDQQGQRKRWALHVGDSFGDVSRGSGYYRFVETLLHRGVTAGCTATTYCPAAAATREQMAVFVLVAKEGPDYSPPPCGPTARFDDVPSTSPFCRWIEELARRGVVGGCTATSFCPGTPVTREQMAIFVLRTLDPFLAPPFCEPPNLFADVPETSPYCRFIEELARRGVVTGCDATHYCPADAVTREQMAVFLSLTFGLTLYGG